MQVPSDLIKALDAGDRTFVFGHVTPDADCLGAMLAMAAALHRDLKKPAKAVLPAGSITGKLAFLTQTFEDLMVSAIESPNGHDAAVIVDTAKPSRINVTGDKEAVVSNGSVVNIDHHVTNTRFGTTDWVEDHASSSCEMVYWLFKHAGWEVTPPIATLLFAGIHSDTAGFSLPTATPSALQAASELVAAGADVEQIGERLYRSMNTGEFDLYRIFYDNTRVACDGRVAYSSATFEEIAGTGCSAADIDDQVGIPRMIAGIRIAMLFTEGDRGRVRINFRGEKGLTVLPLAKHFGGGGHTTSAGTIMKGNVEDVVKAVLAEAGRYLDSYKPGAAS